MKKRRITNPSCQCIIPRDLLRNLRNDAFVSLETIADRSRYSRSELAEIERGPVGAPCITAEVLRAYERVMNGQSPLYTLLTQHVGQALETATRGYEAIGTLSNGYYGPGHHRAHDPTANQ